MALASQTARGQGLLPPDGPAKVAPQAVPSNGQEIDYLRALLRTQQEQIQQQEKRLRQLEKVASPTTAVTPAGLVTTARQPPLAAQSPDAPPGGMPEFAGDTPPAPSRPNPELFKAVFGQDAVPFTVGGQYRVMFNASNFQNHSTTLGSDEPLTGFGDQRFRTWMTVNPNEHVEAYIQVQMGSMLFGQNNEFPKTYAAPLSITNDQVGIMLRRGFLTYQSEDAGRWRIGIQDFTDSFGEVLASADWDFEVGGVTWMKTFKEMNDLRVLIGAFIIAEPAALQSDNAYLFSLDIDQPLASKKNAIGFSVYYLPDYNGYSYPTVGAYSSAWDIWVGVRYKDEIASIPWNTWVIWNFGQRENIGAPEFEHSGFAAKLEAGAFQCGIGKLSVQTLYATGGQQGSNYSGEFRTIAQSERDNFGAQGYWGYLPLIAPYGPTDVNDMGVSLQNRGLGLFTVQGRYEIPLTTKLTATTAAGYLRSAIANPTSASCDMGWEMAETFTLNLTGGLTIDSGVAYLLTGDFYRAATTGPRPNGLVQLFTRVQLVF